VATGYVANPVPFRVQANTMVTIPSTTPPTPHKRVLFAKQEEERGFAGFKPDAQPPKLN
jgi:hypothetical protein